MGTVSQKLEYLNTTKGKIKDSINLTGAGITNEDTFRSYAVKLRDGLVQVLNDNGDTLYNNFPKASGSGSNITLNNTLEAPMRNDMFKGNTLQDGTPTPSTPIEIQSVEGIQNITISDGTDSDSYEVNLEGKNLLINNGTSQILNGVTFIKNSDGSILVNGTSNATVFYYIIPDNTFPLNTKNMVLNGCPAGGSTSSYELRVTYTDNTNVRDIGDGASLNNKTIKAVMIRLQANTTFNNLVFKPMIRYSSITDDSYVAYREPIELCKIGTYQDYIYKNGENWYKYKEIAKIELLSTLNWFRDNEKPNSWRFYSQSNVIPNSHNNEAMSNYFKGDTIANVNNIDNQAITTINYNQIALRINKSIASTVDDLKTWLSNNEVYDYTILTTPTTEQITDTYLISQLNALYNAKSYNGQTNISVSGQLPMILDVSALKDEI